MRKTATNPRTSHPNDKWAVGSDLRQEEPLLAKSPLLVPGNYSRAPAHPWTWWLHAAAAILLFIWVPESSAEVRGVTGQ